MFYRLNERIVCSVADPADLPVALEAGVDQQIVLSAAAISQARREAPRILYIADKEALNWNAAIHFSLFRPGAFEPAGIIVPGTHIDESLRTVTSMAEQVRETRSYGKRSDGFEDLDFSGPDTDIFLRHVSYDPKRLSDAEYRAEYNQRLVQAVDECCADFIFLSNYKLVLPPEVVARYAGSIINVHPSILPVLKGFRSENEVVNRQRFPDASGYTIHFVSEELDCGAVLFQQHVAPPPYDQAAAEREGIEAYERRREEQHRLDIIGAEAWWTPRVLGVIAARWDLIEGGTRIVSDAEAFAAEGRAGFERSDSFMQSLRIDYEHWRTSTGEAAEFESWREEIRQPYRRILFNFTGSYQTLEQAFNAPQTVLAPERPGAYLYSFVIRGSNTEAYRSLAQIEDSLRAIDRGYQHSVSSRYDTNSGCISVSLISGVESEATEVFAAHGVTDLARVPLPVRVGAKRRLPGD